MCLLCQKRLVSSHVFLHGCCQQLADLQICAANIVSARHRYLLSLDLFLLFSYFWGNCLYLFLSTSAKKKSIYYQHLELNETQISLVSRSSKYSCKSICRLHKVFSSMVVFLHQLLTSNLLFYFNIIKIEYINLMKCFRLHTRHTLSLLLIPSQWN